MKNKIIKFTIKSLISLAFISWIILRVNWGEVLQNVEKIKIMQIFFYLAVYLFGILISSYKWQLLAKFKNIKVSIKKLFEFYLAGTFINNFMPSFIGGDTYRAYQLGQEEKKYVQSASTVVMDRITGLIGAMILTLVFSALNWNEVSRHSILVSLDLILVLLLVSGVVFLQLTKLKFWKKISSKVPQKLTEIIRDFHEYNKFEILFKAIFFGMLFGLIGLAGVNLILFYAMGIHIGTLDYLSVIFLISVVSALPVSINNIGIKEWAYITFFGFFGIASSAVITVAIVSRFLQMFVSFFALPLYLKTKK